MPFLPTTLHFHFVPPQMAELEEFIFNEGAISLGGSNGPR